jgi:hypothetical protein
MRPPDRNAARQTGNAAEDFPLGAGRAIMEAMQVRRTIFRALAIVLIGTLVFAPLAVSAASAVGADDGAAYAAAMDMASAAADEMPCHHEQMPDTGKHCPYMAICIALCCQGVAPVQAMLPIPALAATRLSPSSQTRLDGIELPPPSHPPKA